MKSLANYLTTAQINILRTESSTFPGNCSGDTWATALVLCLLNYYCGDKFTVSWDPDTEASSNTLLKMLINAMLHYL